MMSNYCFEKEFSKLYSHISICNVNCKQIEVFFYLLFHYKPVENMKTKIQHQHELLLKNNQ